MAPPCHVDELFIAWRKRFRIAYRGRIVELGPGEMTVVPRGVGHRSAADAEAEILTIEPESVRNTGDVVDERYTAPVNAPL